jgi:protein-disulfide isomerase
VAQSKKPQGKKPQSSAPQSGSGNRVFYLIGGLIVIAGIGWLVAARGGNVGTTAALPTPAEFEGIAATIEPDKGVGIVQGSPDAPVEILEFADYSCPHCGTFASFAGKLLRQNYVETPGGPVRWITFDFVLGGFPNSIPASMAARCAGEQGAYWPYHDMLFSRQTQWYTSPNPGNVMGEIADDLGLDTGAWRSCMSEARYLEQIAAARKYGESLGVGSTPTIFINGQRLDLTGVEPYSYIEGLIKQALAGGADEGADEVDGSP